MDRRAFLVGGLSILMGSQALCFSPANAQSSLRQQLVGVWTYVHNYNVLPDGKRIEPQGPEGTGKGILVLDASGRFVLNLIRADIPKFASNNRQQGTEAENKATAQGAIAYFGAYEVDEPNSSFPNFNGSTQRRDIKLENDELTIINATGASGGTAYITWKRNK